MTPMFKTRYSIFYSLLFVSIVCASFAAFGNNLKKTGPCYLQIAESDNPREALKRTLYASKRVKSYRLRIETPSVSKDVIIIERAFPNSVRIFENNEELICIGKNIYHKKGDGTWKKYPETNNYVFMTNLPANVLQNHIMNLIYAEDVKFIGQETVDGVPTLAYQHTRHPGTRPYTEKSWIGVTDRLLRRWEFECVVSGSTPSPVVHTYYDYNADIKIEPPTEYVSAPELPKGLNFTDQGSRVNTDCVYTIRGGMGAGLGVGLGVGVGRGVGPGTGTNPNASATSVDSKPVPLNRPRPNYTAEARKNKIQGIVRLRILVGPDGSVKQVKLVRGLPDGLDEEAIRAAYLLRFKPAMKDGQPVAYVLAVDIEFNLGNDRIR